MGLVKALALLPLAPVEGVVWVARQIQAQADREMFGPDALWQEVAELQYQLDEGLIGEAEYAQAEAEILDRLEAMEEPDER